MKFRGVVLSLLVVCVLLGGVVAFTGTAAADTIEVENTLAETPEDGEVDVKTQVGIPGGTTSLEITIPEGADVYETDGFSRSATDDRTYQWDRMTDQPFVRYSLEGNVTIDRGSGEQFIYAVTDEWAIVRSPSINVRWSGTTSEIERSNQVDGEGVAGPHITYIGPYEEIERNAAGQRFHLVVPDDAALREDPDDILDAFEYSAERLDIGERDDEVLIIAAPAENNDIDWAATGIQRGDADMWVRDVEELDNPRNTWIHEYVHTLQDYDRTDRTRWTIEGMADYYTALLSYEAGYIDFDTFEGRMEHGASERYEDVQLDTPSTWEGNRGDYEKGALVFGHLDRLLRVEADTTLDAVIAEFNDPDEEFTQEQFLDIVEEFGDSGIRADTRQFTETTDTPRVWSREEHVEAFGGADIRYEFDSFAVSGEYRETALEDPTVVTGETLETTLRIENVGDDEGEFNASFRVGSDRVGGESGTLGPGETTTVTFMHTFEEAGTFALEAGTASTTAVVEEPAGIEVTDLTVDPTTAAIGEEVRLRAAVDAGANRPADGEVTFTVNGEQVATERVQFVGSTMAEATMTFDSPGEYTVEANGRSVTVTVEDETVTPGTDTPTPGTDGTPPEENAGMTPAVSDGTGFGAGVTIAALTAALLLFRRRY